MTELILMVGAPGSGKSTEAAYFMRRYIGQYYSVNYFSRDEIRFNLLGDNKDYFSKEKEVFKIFVESIQNSIDNKVDYVIADATHISKNSRKKLLSKLSNLNDCNLRILIIDTNLDTCLRQNNLREGLRRVPSEVVEEMYNTLRKEYPNIKEFEGFGFKKVFIEKVYNY